MENEHVIDYRDCEVRSAQKRFTEWLEIKKLYSKFPQITRLYIYYKFDSVRETRETVNQYVVEDTDLKRYAAFDFLKFEMVDEKTVSS